ncbi:MAG: hypothetical protein WBX15_11435 [Thermoanaerobaculia bacterium]
MQTYSTVYRIPSWGVMEARDEEGLGGIAQTMRMVLEDDFCNAAHWGVQMGRVPPIRPVIPLNAVKRSGLKVVATNRIKDEALQETLTELLQRLAMLGMYVQNTNHLTDRELYVRLVDDVLRRKAILVAYPGYGCIIDMKAEEPSISDRDTSIPRFNRVDALQLPS